jgi:hypothetical protein
VRWDARLGPQVVLSGAGLLLALPLLASAAGREFLRARVELVDDLVRNHRYRELTGYLALALVGFQLLLSARKRGALPLKGPYAGWRSAHLLVGVGLVLVIVAHTGGRSGANLNGLLLGAFLAVTFVGLAGKAAEAWLIERLTQIGRGRPAAPAPVLPASGPALIDQAAVLTVPVGGGAAAALEARARMRSAGWGAGRPGGAPLTRLRSVWLAAHVLIVCLMLVLLAYHVFSVYYF